MLSKAGLIHLTKCVPVALAPGAGEPWRRACWARPQQICGEQVETGRSLAGRGQGLRRPIGHDVRTNTMTGGLVVIRVAPSIERQMQSQ
jgi:hypothetical protein